METLRNIGTLVFYYTRNKCIIKNNTINTVKKIIRTLDIAAKKHITMA